jgi:hypothetical protein
MAKKETGNSAPATSPAKLVHNTRPMLTKAREPLQDQSNGLPVLVRRLAPQGPDLDLILWIIIIMLLVRFAIALFAGK